LVKKRSGESIPGSQCLTYRPLSTLNSSYVHNISAIHAEQDDDVMKALIERADVHQLEVQFLPIYVLPSEVPSQTLGISASNQSDLMLVSSTFSADLTEAGQGADHRIMNMLHGSRCITAVLLNSQGSWPLSEVRRVLLVLVAGVHGTAAVRLGQVLALHGAGVTALNVPGMFHDQRVPSEFACVGEHEEPKEPPSTVSNDVSIELAKGLVPKSTAEIVKAVANEIKFAASAAVPAEYSLIIIPDLASVPSHSPHIEKVHEAMNQFGCPVLLVRAPGDKAIRGSFVYSILSSM